MRVRRTCGEGGGGGGSAEKGGMNYLLDGSCLLASLLGAFGF
jgi:hypothetical protein